jgi:hypothetical protein
MLSSIFFDYRLVGWEVALLLVRIGGEGECDGGQGGVDLRRGLGMPYGAYLITRLKAVPEVPCRPQSVGRDMYARGFLDRHDLRPALDNVPEILVAGCLLVSENTSLTGNSRQGKLHTSTSGRGSALRHSSPYNVQCAIITG